MIALYRKLFDLLDARERRRFRLLLGLIVVMGLVDMVGVAAILPFLSVLADPGVIESNRQLAALYHGLGFSSERAFLVFLGLVVLGVIAFNLCVKVITLYATARFSHMRNHSLSSRLFGGYLGQPYVWFLDRHSADLGASLLYEVDRVVGQALIPAMRILAHAVSFFFLFGLLLLVEPFVALGATAVLGGGYGLIFLLARRLLTRIGHASAEANAERYRIAQEALGGIKDVKLLGLEQTYLARYRTPSRRLGENASLGQVIGEMPRHLLEAIAFGSMILLVLVLLTRGSGQLNDVLPTLGVFAFAGLRMFPAIQQIYHALTQMRFVGPMLDRVHRSMVETQARSPRTVPQPPLLRLEERLDLVEVGYAYPQAGRGVLQGLSLTIPARTTVGIVGGTGAGKTTAVDLILGLLTPNSGEIRVDGTPLSAGNLRGWQRTLGYVPQHIFLIDDTVAANVAFGIPPERRDMAAIERAARLAELHGFVTGELPQGYDTAVGERGVRLSGGQRQRIGIARALYHDPDVLILDEATSALDTLTETAVMEAVANVAHAKTVIMIAHRLSTVKDCDTIFLLDRGGLAAQGSYAELVATNETFRKMAGASLAET